MADIPQAILDRLDRLEKQNEDLQRKVDEGTVRNVREEAEAQLAAIRKKSLFAGLGEPRPHHHDEGQYPFALYRKSTKTVPVLTDKGVPVLNENGEPKTVLALDVRGDALVDVVYALSDADKAEKIAAGWFVNPLGIADRRVEKK